MTDSPEERTEAPQMDDDYIRKVVREELSVEDGNGRRWSFDQLLSLGLTRRQAIVALGAIGAGMASGPAIRRALSSAIQPAQAAHGGGAVGEAANPVDVFANAVEAASINNDGSPIDIDDVPSRSGVAKGSTSVLIRAFESTDTAGAEVMTQPTDDVSTSAVTILDSNVIATAYVLIVHGDEQGGTSRFTDVLSAMRLGTNITNRWSETFNAPAGRTYDYGSGSIQLAMASGTYDVVAGALMVRRDTNASS